MNRPNPQLSVVIGSHNTRAVIPATLAALLAQTSGESVEVIVADSSSDGTDELIRQQFPGVKLLHFDQPMNVAQRYGKAIAAASGQIIAVLAPYAIPGEGWFSELLKAHQEHPHPVIGGTVDLYQADRQGLLAWAAYINEYAMFMTPLPEGEMEILPGSNLSYKRPALFDGDRPRQVEFWKTFANWDLEKSGPSMWEAPKIRVELDKPIPFGDYFRTRVHHGRCFAGMRAAHLSKKERAFRAITTPLLPFVLIARWGRRYWAKRRYRSKIILTLPLQLLLFGYWSVGELVGYLFGPGRSCQGLYY